MEIFKRYAKLVHHSISTKFSRIVLVILLVLGLLVAISFVVRNPLLQYSLDAYIKRFNHSLHADLQVHHARFSGLRTVEVEGIMLKPATGDTLLRIDAATASVSLWKLLAGRIALTDFTLENTHLSLVRQDSLTNYMFLIEKPVLKKNSTDTLAERNYAARVNNIMKAVFDKVPDNLRIVDFTVSTRYNDHNLVFHVDTFALTGHRFQSPVTLVENGLTNRWLLEGIIDKYEHTARFSLCNADSGKVSLPFLSYRWQTKVAFDTARFSITEVPGSDNRITISGTAALHGLELNHPRIAAETILFGRGTVDYTLHVTKDAYELDSITECRFNGVSLHPYLKYRPKPSKQITLKINQADFPSQQLFDALPAGLFRNFEGIKTKGDLSFHLFFYVDLSQPDSLHFTCELNRKNFGVVSYGRTRFTAINDTFTYTAYEKGEAVRSFLVGLSNPNFRSLDKISPYLRNAVLNSEDGAFFGHRGFLPESFRESIATNIKERRFARGGSTITMQLVKNVFLNRNKTITRKLEEVLIVWLIENQQLITKERMFEVYLNIIEWGPGVYGAQEASQYYFNKDVSRLTYAEALFMTSIIPRPKYFMYSFDNASGQLRDYVNSYYQLMAGKMLRKEMITQQDYDVLKPEVNVTGPARLLIHQQDSLLPVDSILNINNGLIFP